MDHPFPKSYEAIMQKLGVDAFCALIAKPGRFHNNAERIINAADYFVQKHKGYIPPDITIQELSTLHGVGYKTANILITSAFQRVDGIPSDVHVICWCQLLGWNHRRVTYGDQYSKFLESWLPKKEWGHINPLFSALGQSLQKAETRDKVLELATTHLSKDLVAIMKTIAKKNVNHISNKSGCICYYSFFFCSFCSITIS